MTSKMIAVSLPEKLIKLLSMEAIINHETRSEYIKRAIIERMRADGVDIKAEPRTPQEAAQQKLKEFLAELDHDTYEGDISDEEEDDDGPGF